MGLAFGGQAGKPYSQQKSIAAFHVDKIFDRASCNGWGDAYAFGDPSSANFDAETRRELLCGKTEAGLGMVDSDSMVVESNGIRVNLTNDLGRLTPRKRCFEW